MLCIIDDQWLLLPASCLWKVRPDGPKIALPFLLLFVCVLVGASHLSCVQYLQHLHCCHVTYTSFKCSHLSMTFSTCVQFSKYLDTLYSMFHLVSQQLCTVRMCFLCVFYVGEHAYLLFFSFFFFFWPSVYPSSSQKWIQSIRELDGNHIGHMLAMVLHSACHEQKTSVSLRSVSSALRLHVLHCSCH